MEAERLLRLENLFNEALELADSERSTFLEEQCGDDPELRAEVMSLVAAHERAGGFMEAPDAAPVPVPVDDNSPLADADVLSPYRLLRKLGEGESSTVYLAVRAEAEYHKLVAVKLVKRGMDTDRILRRFHQERQILAALDHPNIAQLYDGGRAGDGRPFFVMEYVDGRRIDDHCTRDRLSVEARLELFRTVCSAVHFAHQNLVIHRDLKPGNILVTSRGRPKLLDFGIAKLLDPELTEDLTATAGRLLTPRYASPEQVQGRAVTTATDVYSLGVLLYELLTDREPYTLTDGSLAELEKVICESEPAPPSAVVEERRGRRLAGDLDTIALKALRKEPERRYGSVQELSDDIRRHLQDLPVEARPDTVGYRVGKFIRRHVLGVVAAGVMLASLLAGVVIANWQAAVARAERNRAATQQVRAEKVSNFLVDLFEVSDPGEALGNSVTAREILDRGADQISRELADQPEVQATLMDTMGRVYLNLGLYERAQELIEGGLEIRRGIYSADSLEIAASLAGLGSVLQKRGRHEEAEQVLRDAVAIQRSLLEPTDSTILETVNSVALAQAHQAEYEAAEQSLNDALAVQRSHRDPDPDLLTTTLNNLAFVMDRQGRYGEAEPLLREALQLIQSRFGDTHPSVALCLNNLSGALQGQGKFDEAERLQRETLRMRRELLGDEHYDVATSLNNLATLVALGGRRAEAEQLLRESLAVVRAAVGADHPRVALGLNNLAANLSAQGRHAEAEPLLRQALELTSRTLGDDHPQVAMCRGNLAQSIEDQGRLADAEPLYRRSLAGFRAVLGDEHPHTAIAANNLALLMFRMENYEESEVLFREAVGILESIGAGRHPHVAACYLNIGSVLVELGRDDEAEEAFRQAIELGSEVYSDGDVRRAQPLQALGTMLADRGDPAAAEPLLRQAVAIRQQALPENDRRLAEAKGSLGACLTDLRRFDDAEQLLLESRAALEATEGVESPRTDLAQQRLTELYEAWGRTDDRAAQ